MVKKIFRPVEIVLLGYLAITLVPALWQTKNHPSGVGTLTAHLLLMVCIAGIACLFQRLTQPKNWQIIVRILYPLALLGFLYGETDFLNNVLVHENLDPLFAQWESAIFGFQPALEFSKAFPSQLLAETMYFGYFAYYLLVIFVPLYWLKQKGLPQTEKLVFIIIQSFLIFYLIFDVLPVAGPQFQYSQLQHEVPDGYIFGFLIKRIQQIGEAPTAAFPSSHVALCLILLYQVYRGERKLFYYLMPIGILLIFSTVYLRAHYVIDCLAAILIAPVIYKLVHTIQKILFAHFPAIYKLAEPVQMTSILEIKNY
ncbi:MAG TPA: hypothetical protein DCQ26_02660 [Marinilabiliales bacterium]|nr:MAG: hypothetical protein A2W95_18600 [Bacteroidetes bacterium GWA2_40_14]OFX62240.1 MAG: hypothetical protein A2W84_12270 [Bacteroidetes bacterium GWC2_40_13]OFX73796.1 MAG: hypothetical protein A2W96_07965 [Bacteroidetes bacterium GWD2_40_43]OFX89424.1 MAG: hypothetical protein A2W97_13785 [Bacteroidetes bacterium GWE2_40_63]OFY23250.1 MAG: hypothetical protein A2W88_19445 [Bacteroidetes bacterium GWF2_40_13]OFZ28141.1 MAG: hypothetical protein A2437_04550 [Bacteroidetes bacterium RIFOXYC